MIICWSQRRNDFDTWHMRVLTLNGLAYLSLGICGWGNNEAIMWLLHCWAVFLRSVVRGTMSQCHHWAALATDPCPDIVQAVSARPLGIDWPVTELRRRVATTWHHNSALLVPRILLKFGKRTFGVAGLTAWNNRHPDNQQHSNFQQETQNMM